MCGIDCLNAFKLNFKNIIILYLIQIRNYKLGICRKRIKKERNDD